LKHTFVPKQNKAVKEAELAAGLLHLSCAPAKLTGRKSGLHPSPAQIIAQALFKHCTHIAMQCNGVC
jgi:hypothetical protein